jgi:hypothetical protein
MGAIGGASIPTADSSSTLYHQQQLPQHIPSLHGYSPGGFAAPVPASQHGGGDALCCSLEGVVGPTMPAPSAEAACGGALLPPTTVDASGGAHPKTPSASSTTRLAV